MEENEDVVIVLTDVGRVLEFLEAKTGKSFDIYCIDRIPHCMD